MSTEEIEYLKSQYGDIYSITLLGVEYIYRTINIGEFHRIYTASQSDVELEDEVIREALLYPDLFTRDPGSCQDYALQVYRPTISSIIAGVPTVLAGHILECSCIGNISEWDALVVEKKNNITGGKDPSTDPIIGRIVTITEAFKYSPIELYAMNADQLLDLCAWAEIKIQVLNELVQGQSKGQSRSEVPAIAPEYRRKMRYSQEELEQMSMDASTKALSEEMKKYAGSGS